MIKKLVVGLAILTVASEVQAKSPYIEEVKALGSVSGQGLACGASKYDKFEMLARAIMLSKAPSQALLQKGAYAYNEAKAEAYLFTESSGGFLCDETRARFDNQDIYKIVLYEDGTLKMPDGSIITPKIPYDASKIYYNDTKLKKNLKAIYEGSKNRVKKATAVPNNQAIEKRETMPVYKAVTNNQKPREQETYHNNYESAIKHISRH